MHRQPDLRHRHRHTRLRHRLLQPGGLRVRRRLGSHDLTRQPLTSVAIDTHVTRTLHINVWDILIHSVENLKDALLGDFIGCGKAI